MQPGSPVLSKEEMQSNVARWPFRAQKKKRRKDWLLDTEVVQKAAGISDVVKKAASPPGLLAQDELMLIGI